MNDEKFIEEVEHVAVEPVRIEREHNDVIVIEGVRYAGDYFRTMAVPDADVLYAVRRDDDQVWLTVIRNLGDANLFFFQQDLKKQLPGRGNPAPTNGGA